MSLKTVTIGNSLADIKNREGVEGLLIGIVIEFIYTYIKFIIF